MEFLRNKTTGVVWPKTDLLAEQSHFEPCAPPDDYKPAKGKRAAAESELPTSASIGLITPAPEPPEPVVPEPPKADAPKASWQDIEDKSELDAYAKEVGVALDRRQSLAKMKEKLAAALKKKG